MRTAASAAFGGGLRTGPMTGPMASVVRSETSTIAALKALRPALAGMVSQGRSDAVPCRPRPGLGVQGRADGVHRGVQRHRRRRSSAAVHRGR